MRLKYKILIRFLLVTIVPISFLGLGIYFYTANNLTEKTLDNLESISNLQKKRINELIDRNYERVTSLAASPQIISGLSSIQNENPHNVTEFEKFLNLKKSVTPQYDCVSVVNLKGVVVASTDNKLDNKLFFNQHIYEIGKTNSYVNIDLDQSGKPILFLSTPIQQNETILGTLIAQVNTKDLLTILHDYTGLGNTGDLILVKRDRADNTDIIFPPRYANNTGFDIVMPLKEIDEPTVRAAFGQESRLVNILDHNGNNVLAVTNYFPTTQWGLAVKIDQDEAFSGIQTLKNTIMIISGGLFFTVILVSLFLSKSISAPIDKLRLSCRRVAKGNLNENVDTTSSEPEYKDLAFDINYMIQELKKVEKSKNEFISMISHELKTPLVSIMGYSEMLSDPNLLGNLKPSQSQALSIIYTNSRRLRQLIDDLLVTQGLELNSLKFDKQEIHVTEFMNNTVSSNRVLTLQKNIELVNSTKDDVKITSDGLRLGQIFSNLIQNAIDFSSQNGRIEIGATLDYDKVIFYVKDNGVGIPKNKQGDLFKKFYQVDTSLKRTHGGTGLGLSICKGLVEGMGGKIWVESEEGKGTTFYFSIPIKNS